MSLDDIVKELEEATSLQLLAVKSEDRKAAEEKILRFRSYNEPYDLCSAILARSKNDCLLYEAGRCLSQAVVREWDSVFAESLNDRENSKASQLLAFVVDWAKNHGFECNPAPRQRILGVAGALTKRAAAAHAEHLVHVWRSTKSNGNRGSRSGLGSRVLTSPPEDPGPPCPLLITLIETIESLIGPLLQADLNNNSIELLHTWVRRSDVLGTRTLSCLLRLSILTGPLIDPVSTLNNNSNENLINSEIDQPQLQPNTIYLLSFIEHLNNYLIDPNDMKKELNSSLKFIINYVPNLNEFISHRLVNLNQLPSILTDQLLPYELPLLSELILNLVLQSSCTWDPIDRILSLPNTSTTINNNNNNNNNNNDNFRNIQSSNSNLLLFQYALISLYIMDRFFTSLSSLLTQCIRFLVAYSSKSSLDDDGDSQSAHEAVERLFNSWSELIDLITFSLPRLGYFENVDNNIDNDQNRNDNIFDESDHGSPIPLTTGAVQNSYVLAGYMKKFIRVLKSGIVRHQSHLFQTYVLSKLAMPIGLRPIISEDHQEIDLDLDEDDLNAAEESLFTIGSCGLASVTESVSTLLNLLDTRITHLIYLHKSDKQNSTVNVLEDLHWLLMITGHFLVCGPASLSSVIRAGRPWDTQFSIPQELLKLNSNTPVDVYHSRRLLYLAMNQCPNLNDNWPPESLPMNNIPTLVCLFSSLFRLLWLQVAHGLGSAQLVIDNFWLMTRWAVTYLCHNVMDRNSISASAYKSPILTILQTNPSNTNELNEIFFIQSNETITDNNDATITNTTTTTTNNTNNMNVNNNQNELKGNQELNENFSHICTQSLLTCIRYGLENWSHEPQVINSITQLLSVLSLYAPDPSSSLVCPALYDIYSMVCGPQASTHAWSNLNSDSLIQLVEACLCGSWAIATLNNSQPDSDTLILQIVRGIREHVINILNVLSDNQSVTTNFDVLINCMTVLRGVSRAMGLFTSIYDSITDIVSLMWDGLLAPFLYHGAHFLIVKYHYNSELIQSLFSLYSDVADSCLIYLTILPSANKDVKLTNTNLNQNQINKSNTNQFASNCFLDWTVILCKNYAKQNLGKLSTEATAEDDCMTELRLLLTLLNRVFYHEFELRLGGAIVLSRGDEPSSQNYSDVGDVTKPIPTVDAAIIGLGYLLPLINESVLSVPELSHTFYSLASYACELRAEGFQHLSDDQLCCFGRLIRLGIFGPNSIHIIMNNSHNNNNNNNTNNNNLNVVQNLKTNQNQSTKIGFIDNTIIQQCLNVVISVTDHFLDLRSHIKSCTVELQQSIRLINLIGFNTEFLSDLFNLLTHETYTINLETSFSAALLNLIHLSPESYNNLINQWINGCPDQIIQNRLSQAFEHLGSAYTEQTDNSNTSNMYISHFKENKPTRIERSDFQKRFHLFVAEMRSFICRV